MTRWRVRTFQVVPHARRIRVARGEKNFFLYSQNGRYVNITPSGGVYVYFVRILYTRRVFGYYYKRVIGEKIINKCQWQRDETIIKCIIIIRVHHTRAREYYERKLYAGSGRIRGNKQMSLLIITVFRENDVSRRCIPLLRRTIVPTQRVLRAIRHVSRRRRDEVRTTRRA